MSYVTFMLIIQYNFVNYGVRNYKSARERERERDIKTGVSIKRIIRRFHKTMFAT